MDVGELYYVARRLKWHVEAALGAADGQAEAVPPIHQLVLGLVLSSPGSAVGEIARGLGLAQSAVSAAVASLRDQQLVVTKVDGKDRRVSRVSPSPRLATWAAKKLHVDAAAVIETLLADRTPRERRCALDGLTILHDAFTRRDQVSPAEHRSMQ
ncbi:MAG TPA: MarR family transcriptional regulator [Acidimicrobiales bacterium]